MKNKTTRKKEASVRTQEYLTLTSAQKILKLDLKLGNGVGAVKERKKLDNVLVSTPKEKFTKIIITEVKKPYQKSKKS